MKVRVLFFAGFRDLTGNKEDEIELKNTATLEDLRREVLAKYPILKDRINRLLVALNESYAGPNTRLKDGDKVALFPPVSGG